MHLASISSQEDNERLEKHVNDFGKRRWWRLCSNNDFGGSVFIVIFENCYRIRMLVTGVLAGAVINC